MKDHTPTLERLAYEHQVDSLTLLEFFLERASIREYDGAQSRAEAERGALQDIERWLEGRK